MTYLEACEFADHYGFRFKRNVLGKSFYANDRLNQSLEIGRDLVSLYQRNGKARKLLLTWQRERNT